MTRKKIMPTRRTNRASLASGALILALIIFASIAQAQTNACYKNGNPRNGILDATLNGAVSGTKVQISIPTVGRTAEPDKWSRRRDGGSFEGVNKTVLDSTTNTILVPANEVALVWLTIEGSEQPQEIRLESALQNSFQPVAPTLLIKRDGNTLLMCDDNSSNSEAHTWYFSLKIGGTWYDPQIKNDGSGPPPPPPPM